MNTLPTGTRVGSAHAVRARSDLPVEYATAGELSTFQLIAAEDIASDALGERDARGEPAQRLVVGHLLLVELIAVLLAVLLFVGASIALERKSDSAHGSLACESEC